MVAMGLISTLKLPIASPMESLNWQQAARQIYDGQVAGLGPLLKQKLNPLNCLIKTIINSWNLRTNHLNSQEKYWLFF